MLKLKNLLSGIGTFLTICLTIIGTLWCLSGKFTHLEVEQIHNANQIHNLKLQLEGINKKIKVVPLNSQLILIEKNNISKNDEKLTIISKEIENYQLKLNNYIDKTYFYRDMQIIKNDFRSTNTKVYVNSREINYLRGKFTHDISFSE